MEQLGEFPAATAVLTVVKVDFTKGKFLSQASKWRGEPHKRSAWIFNAEVLVSVQTEFYQVAGDLIQEVGT